MEPRVARDVERTSGTRTLYSRACRGRCRKQQRSGVARRPSCGTPERTRGSHKLASSFAFARRSLSCAASDPNAFAGRAAIQGGRSRGALRRREMASELVARIDPARRRLAHRSVAFARFAQYDSAIERLIDRLEERSRAATARIPCGEVLSEFTPDMMSTILATAAIPEASLEDIAAATGIRHATPIIDRLLNLPGFISSETGAYQAHPLLLGTIRAQHGADETNYLIRAAQQYEDFGRFPARRRALSRLWRRSIGGRAPSIDFRRVCCSSRPPASSTRSRGSKSQRYARTQICGSRCSRTVVSTSKPYASMAKRRGCCTHCPRRRASPLQRRLRVRLAHLAQELEQLAEAESLLEASRAGGRRRRSSPKNCACC